MSETMQPCAAEPRRTNHLARLWRAVCWQMYLHLWCGWLYRPVMRLAHRFHWHYAPPMYPDGDTMLWCQWCGFRAVVRRRGDISLAAREALEGGKG